MDREFDVWMEGYSATGQYCPHEFVGKAIAKDFKTACAIAVKERYGEEEFNKYYDADRCSYWGCRCFDNEEDASRLCG